MVLGMTATIGELLLVLGVGISGIGAIDFTAGYLPQEHIPAICALSLILVVAGQGMKRVDRRESKFGE